MLKTWPSKFIPVINAGHEEYISKRGGGWGRVSRTCEGLWVTLGPGERGACYVSHELVVWVCGCVGRGSVECDSLGGRSYAFDPNPVLTGLGIRPLGSG